MRSQRPSLYWIAVFVLLAGALTAGDPRDLAAVAPQVLGAWGGSLGHHNGRHQPPGISCLAADLFRTRSVDPDAGVFLPPPESL